MADMVGDEAERAIVAEARVEEVENRYNELIFSVGRKFDNETRHETALRYIREAENPSGETCAMKEGK